MNTVNWQERYEAGETPWDRGGPAPELVRYLKDHPLTGNVLVPGCGTAHDIAPLLDANATTVTGIDIAPAAVATARQRWQHESRVRIVEADLFDLPASFRSAFDWVWEHTCFCAIPPEMRGAYVTAVADALVPGGQLLAVFFLTPWDPHEDQTQGPPFGVSRAELDRTFSPRFELLEEWAPHAAYPGREGREWMRRLRRRN